MNLLSRFYFRYRRFVKWLSFFTAIVGPGIIVMLADNDAGGITTYILTGALFSFSLLWIIVVIEPAAYVCQEMTVRLGALTKRGHAEAIFEAFGSFWGWFSLLDLVLTDFLTIVTEFIGMTIAARVFGIPPVITTIATIALIMGMVLSGRYWTWEKIVLVFCFLNLIYIPAAFLVNVPLGPVLSGLIPNNPPGGFSSTYVFYVMANIGTTIAPWMIFFQQSSVVDKGLKEKDIGFSRWDTASGVIFNLVATCFIIMIAAAIIPGVAVNDAAQAAIKMMSINKIVADCTLIGLYDAGFLGAICISLASSWAWGEVFGWPHSLNHPVKAAPAFYLYRLIILILAGAIVLIPGAPLVLITLYVQVVAVTLLPAALTFLLILLNEKEVVGERWVNSRRQNILTVAIIASIIVMSTIFALSALFPHLLG
jgi:Mn2+/Fe2+ NRAMP family transporter